MLIWITRSAPDNRRSARRLRALGHEDLCVPVLHVQSTAQPAIGFAPDALAFTSAHGVRCHRFLDALRDIPVFAVGRHTAAAARWAGYRSVRHAEGDVESLQALLAGRLPRGSRVLHLCGTETAGDLTGFLRRLGYSADRHIVYRARPASDAELAPAIGALARIGGILVHSPRGARRVAEIVRDAEWRGTIWCISPECARAFAGLPGVSVRSAPRPNEAALVNLLRTPRIASASGTAGRSAIRAVNDDGLSLRRQRGGVETPSPDPDPEDPPPSAA